MRFSSELFALGFGGAGSLSEDGSEGLSYAGGVGVEDIIDHEQIGDVVGADIRLKVINEITVVNHMHLLKRTEKERRNSIPETVLYDEKSSPGCSGGFNFRHLGIASHEHRIARAAFESVGHIELTFMGC